MPPYFKQENTATCSLAVLRMVLAAHGQKVTESDLIKRIEPDYSKRFSNLWNTTIAKLACEYNIETMMIALWPLFKKDLLRQAVKEFHDDPTHFNVIKYENPEDNDVLPEPLPLAYKEAFLAIEKGCIVKYGSLTKARISQAVNTKSLIQTTVKVDILHPGAKKGFHSILIYNLEKDIITYHDPYIGPSRKVDLQHLLHAASDVGAFMVYSNNKYH